jgi:tRNA modification GTPase
MSAADRWLRPTVEPVIELADTIVAIASPTAPAERGIVRMSGPQTIAILSRLGVAGAWGHVACRFDAVIDVGQPLGGIPLSVMLWPTGRSYTGQPSAEFHTFGSLPILRSLVDAAIAAGARPARPGEFTLRAFLAGRLDLTQAEAVLGVIEAQQRGALDHALRQLAGNLSRPLEQLRATVLDLLADVEAGLDFVDEDIEFISDATLIERLCETSQQLDALRDQMQARGGGADRPLVTLRGEPNAGKSCLMNRLCGQDVAIVGELAGTTRDAIVSEVELLGLPVSLVDTAGMEQADSELARQAQQQARRAAAEARLRLWCVDSGRDDFPQACRRAQLAAQAEHRPAVLDLWIATKVDVPELATGHADWIRCSSKTEFGIAVLQRAIVDALSRRDAQEIGSVAGTAARCQHAFDSACAAVCEAIELTRRGGGHELVAAELRSVAQSLGEVTGAVYTDDILDRVFGRFCIGK